MTHNVEGLTSFLEAAHNYDFPVWYIYDAGLKIATGTNWDPAMNTGILDYDASWMPEHLKGLDVFRRMWNVGSLFPPPGKPEPAQIVVAKPASAEATVACVVSCDQQYFDWYFDDFYSSFCEIKSSRDVLHIHIVNPIDLAGIVDRTKHDGNLSLSFENTEYTPAAYYACARFWVARHVMDLYSCPIIILDFDSTFIDSPAVLFGGIEENLARPAKPPKLPWQQWMASFLFLIQSEDSRRFLSNFESTALSWLRQRSMEHWYLDQNAFTFLMHREPISYAKSWRISSKLYRQTTKYKELKRSRR